MRSPLMVGDRVYLRPLDVGDAEALAWIDATETDTFMWRGPMPTSPLEAEQWIEEMYEHEPPSEINFAVCIKEDDRFIGIVDLEDVDLVNRVAETGSFLGPAEVRGRQYGTEAKHLLLEYAFDRLHLHALRSVVWTTNTRSAAALGKQGYRRAGRLTWVDVKDGRYIDADLFDLTRDDWLAAREAWRASAPSSP
jgi:RimJ/RimL family protein N-acetyltransferase